MWLNLIIKLSTLIHKKKEEILAAGIWKSILFSLWITILEILQIIISLPIYTHLTQVCNCSSGVGLKVIG